jgi:hypothetical protein
MGNKAFSDALTFTRASSGSYYAANGALTIAPPNTPRYDYDPVTLAMRGILIEEARSNLLLYSNYFDNTVSWTKTTSTIASNAAISPDGTMSASFMTATVSGGRVTQIAAATATSLTFSIYVKQGNALTQQLIIRNTTTATNLMGVALTWATKTTNNPAAASVTSVGNGWYRFSATVTTGVTIGDSMTFYCYAGGSNNAVGDTVYMYGAQVEAGTFATSYIPTSASAVARSADYMTINTMSSWLNSSEGTMFIEAAAGNNTTFAESSYMAISDGTASNYIGFNRDNALSRVQPYIYASTVSQLSGVYEPTSTTPISVFRKIALAYNTNDVALATSGILRATDTSVTLPTGLNLAVIGASYSTNRYLNGWIKSVKYYPKRLTNAELQALTV